MNKSNVMAYVKSLFECYPSVNEFHFTKDGNGFEQKHNAESHASFLDTKNPEVITITRLDLAKWVSEGMVAPVSTDTPKEDTAADTSVSAETVPTGTPKEDTAADTSVSAETASTKEAENSAESGATISDPVASAVEAKTKQPAKQGRK